MRAASDVLMIIAMAVIGLLVGLLVFPNAGWAVLGRLVGTGMGFLMARYQGRPTIGP